MRVGVEPAPHELSRLRWKERMKRYNTQRENVSVKNQPNRGFGNRGTFPQTIITVGNQDSPTRDQFGRARPLWKDIGRALDRGHLHMGHHRHQSDADGPGVTECVY